MGIGFDTVTQSNPIGFDDFMDDKSLTLVSDAIWLNLFQTLHIPSFFDFIQIDSEQLEGEDFDWPPKLCETQWFEASESLYVFQILKQHFMTHPNILSKKCKRKSLHP